MSQQFPEFVFLAGPQAGQRVLLKAPVLVLGRGADADILLSEEFSSRQHTRFQRLPEGACLECLSKQGMWIDGKLYKAGMKVLLETGDLVGVGRETELLFVAAGDDVDAAEAVEMADPNPRKTAFGKRLVRAKPQEPALIELPEEPAEEAPEAEMAPGAAQAGPSRPAELSADELVAQRSRARRRKIIIFLGLYGVLIVGAFIFFGVVFKTREDDFPIPRLLSDKEIADALSTRPERTPNQVLAEKKLQEARQLHQQYGLDSKNLYRVVHTYGESLSYSARSFFDSSEDDKNYKQALDALTEKVKERYRNAYLLERDQSWVKAEKEFYELLAMVVDPNNPERNKLFNNIQEHHKRVKYFRDKKAPKKRTPWG